MQEVPLLLTLNNSNKDKITSTYNITLAFREQLRQYRGTVRSIDFKTSTLAHIQKASLSATRSRVLLWGLRWISWNPPKNRWICLQLVGNR